MEQVDVREPAVDAYNAGRRAGLGVAALALGVVSFVSMLGLEKALLAVVLGVLAARGAQRGSNARRMGIAGIVLGALFVMTLLVMLVLFWDRLIDFLPALDRLS